MKDNNLRIVQSYSQKYFMRSTLISPYIYGVHQTCELEIGRELDIYSKLVCRNITVKNTFDDSLLMIHTFLCNL